jgi:hypothetical protein
MADPEKTKLETEPDSPEGRPPTGCSQLDTLFAHKGPWTEGDSKWFEAMTGEKDTFPTVPDDPDDLL